MYAHRVLFKTCSLKYVCDTKRIILREAGTQRWSNVYSISYNYVYDIGFMLRHIPDLSWLLYALNLAHTCVDSQYSHLFLLIVLL